MPRAIVSVLSLPCDVSAQVFEGVCTTYMQQLAVGSTVEVFLRVSKFKLPKQLNCPVIMIGQQRLPSRVQLHRRRDGL
jgi:sulfite reductase alpha subunit-like flavoprotein